MLSFVFSPEQEDFRTQLRRFAVAELAPHYNERAARSEFCWEAHRQLGELGVLGIGLPEKHGGTGAPHPGTPGVAPGTLAHGDGKRSEKRRVGEKGKYRWGPNN